MTSHSQPFSAPALVAGTRLTTWLSTDGEVEELTGATAMTRAGKETPIVCHALATATLLRFLKILGDVCGDATLTMGARGGVYLCGGILPRLLDWLPKCELRASFVNKGRMGAYNADIPVRIVTHPWTGLLGAAEALHNEEVF